MAKSVYNVKKVSSIVKLPDEVIDDKRLNGTDIVILHKLACCSRLEANRGRDYDCYVSYNVLQDMSKYMGGVDEFPIQRFSTLSYSISKLERVGYVTIVERGKRGIGATKYKLNFDALMNHPENTPKIGQKLTPQITPQITGHYSTNDGHYSTNACNALNDKTLDTPQITPQITGHYSTNEPHYSTNDDHYSTNGPHYSTNACNTVIVNALNTPQITPERADVEQIQTSGENCISDSNVLNAKLLIVLKLLGYDTFEDALAHITPEWPSMAFVESVISNSSNLSNTVGSKSSKLSNSRPSDTSLSSSSPSTSSTVLKYHACEADDAVGGEYGDITNNPTEVSSQGFYGVQSATPCNTLNAPAQSGQCVVGESVYQPAGMPSLQTAVPQLDLQAVDVFSPQLPQASAPFCDFEESDDWVRVDQSVFTDPFEEGHEVEWDDTFYCTSMIPSVHPELIAETKSAYLGNYSHYAHLPEPTLGNAPQGWIEPAPTKSNYEYKSALGKSIIGFIVSVTERGMVSSEREFFRLCSAWELDPKENCCFSARCRWYKQAEAEYQKLTRPSRDARFLWSKFYGFAKCNGWVDNVVPMSDLKKHQKQDKHSDDDKYEAESTKTPEVPQTGDITDPHTGFTYTLDTDGRMSYQSREILDYVVLNLAKDIENGYAVGSDEREMAIHIQEFIPMNLSTQMQQCYISARDRFWSIEQPSKFVSNVWAYFNLLASGRKVRVASLTSKSFMRKAS